MATCPGYGNVIDLSNFSYPGEPVKYKTLDAVDYVMIAIIGIVMVGTLFGNVSVIISVAFIKSMQKGVNIYVANLAVADLLICAICMTSFLGKTLVKNHIYVLGPAMCKISSFGRVTCLISSVVTLSVIACDRLPAVLCPHRYLTTKQRRGLFISLIWLFSAFVSLPLLFYRKFYEVVFSDFTMPTCGENWPLVYNEEKEICENSPLRLAYYTIVCVLLCFLPVTIISLAYYLILRKVSKPLPGEPIEASIKLQIRNKRKVLRMVITVILFFAICWMPFQIITLYGLYNPNGEPTLPDWYEDVFRLTEFLAFSNSFCNPIIYGFYNKEFRNSLCLVLRCKTRGEKSGKLELFERIRLTLTTSLSTSRNMTKRMRGTSGEKQHVAVTSEAITDTRPKVGNTNFNEYLPQNELGTGKHKAGDLPA